jgi:hypothetical protein
MKTLLLILFFFSTLLVKSQEDFSWWTKIHNWDGHTPWNQYMTMSTSFMGPNSLPVPEIMKGRIDSSAQLELSADYNFSRGDKTKNIFTRGYLPLYENRFAVSIDVIPYEWFKTDTLTRDIRAARGRNGKGGAGGDIYFYSIFQILRNKEKWPDLSFRAAFRLASGTNLRNARYTDGPGYFFDLSAGKNISVKSNFIRVYAMSGFYAYQTFDLQHLQNDCFLYGGGMDFIFKKIIFSQSVAGYSGYLNIGDKPIVYRAGVQLLFKKFDWKFSYQWGLHDYDFQRIRIGVVFHTNLFQSLFDKNK